MTYRNITLSVNIEIYLRLFAYHYHLQKYFYNWNITMNYYFICKINIRDYFIWRYHWQRQMSIFHLTHYFSNFRNLNIAQKVLQSFEVFYLQQNKLICQPACDKETSHWTKIDNVFFRNLDLHDSRFHRKRVAIPKNMLLSGRNCPFL